MARWGKCDCKQLKGLEKKLAQLEQGEWDQSCRQAARELAAILLTKVIKRTPVGVKPKLGRKTVTRTGKGGKKYKLLTVAGVRYETYWAGYTGGTLRRGWLSKTEEEARSGGGAGSVLAHVEALPTEHDGNTYQIIVENPVHYASYVEYGHRQTPGRYVPALGKSLKANWVDGRYMLTISAMEVQEMAPAVVERALYQGLKETLG